MVDPDIKVHMLGTYVALRRLMAFVAAAFLVTLTAYRHYHGDAENSVSAYYYHSNNPWPMKDIFGAALVSMGLLLIAYQGYRNSEKHALNLAGFALICVAFFPMDVPRAANETQGLASTSWHAWIHYTSALTFFAMIGYVCHRRAGDTLAVVSSEARRNAYRATYKLLGWLMMFVPVLALVLNYVSKLESAVYWTEYAGVAVFLAYWIVKSFELSVTRAETPAKLDELPKTDDGPAGR